MAFNGNGKNVTVTMPIQIQLKYNLQSSAQWHSQCTMWQCSNLQQPGDPGTFLQSPVPDSSFPSLAAPDSDSDSLDLDRFIPNSLWLQVALALMKRPPPLLMQV
jgi:hypothetical protein